MKKAINTFSKIGDFLVDEVEVGAADSVIPHGDVDLMVVSAFGGVPPICFFNVRQHTFYHYVSASLKTLTTCGMEASGTLILHHYYIINQLHFIS